MIKKLNFIQILYFSIFTTSLLISYVGGLVFYDSTSGLDFGKYFLNVRYFMGDQVQIGDGNGSLYFYFISKAVARGISGIEQQNINILINNSIQLINFLLFLTGLLGLFLVFNSKKIKSSDIFLSFSILCFLPTAFYFRLTMKPEVMAFAILPWIIYFLDSYFKNKTLINKTISILLLSILFTIKGSITGMSLLSLLYLYRKQIFSNKSTKGLSLLTFITSSIFIYINYLITNFWVFSNNSSDASNPNRWENTAGIEFFTKIDFKNLLENPYQHIHSDSFFSITLLDTIADYFRFFWQHEEKNNYISFDRILFSENFLIQTYLPQYISIIFTVGFYLSIFFLIYKKVEHSDLLILPIFGIAILILNSLGFPSRNFDPTTGDLFKVHYYSFLFTLSFCTLLVILSSILNLKKYLLILFIPLFMTSMGFPKNVSEETKINLYNKINISEFCFIFEQSNNVECHK
jgi:hypothetical protein